jgi:hypothetical protein
MKLDLQNVGQLRQATVQFGDLTVLVGPQASGKSIFLQFLKLAVDKRKVVSDLRKQGQSWEKNQEASFLELFLGEGMAGVWSRDSKVCVDGSPIDIGSAVRIGKADPSEALFFIPAQRVLALNQQGWWRHFSDYRPTDPYVARAFSENIRLLMEQGRFSVGEGSLFPRSNRLKSEIRGEIDDAIFHGFSLTLDERQGQKRLVLRRDGSSLPFMVWSAGQREFVPLLMGLYWLLPPAATKRRAGVEWAVIEELEMGLHPKAISAVMLAVLDLVERGYKVVLSTHSPHVLDVIWGIKALQKHGAKFQSVLDMFALRKTQPTQRIAETALDKSYRTYYFNPVPGSLAPSALDISDLDPGSEDAAVAGWGGLSDFSGRIGDVVARAVNSSGA